MQIMQASQLAMAKKVVLLLVVMVKVLGLASFVCGKQPPQILRHALEVETPMTEARYTSFMAEFRASVTSTTKEDLEGHPVLGKQELKRAPEMWLHVDLTNKAGQILVKLAFRSDNLYLAGFWNRLGGWFTFKGEEGTLPHSTPLSYAGGYADIFGREAHKGLGFIPLNSTLAWTHTNSLGKYRPRYAQDTSIKQNLAFFILAVPEAVRFPPILGAVAAGLGDVAGKTQTIGETLPRLVVNWARLSCALLSWDRHGRTEASWNKNTEAHELATDENLKVHTAKGDKPVDSSAKALTLLVPILRATGCTWT